MERSSVALLAAPRADPVSAPTFDGLAWIGVLDLWEVQDDLRADAAPEIGRDTVSRDDQWFDLHLLALITLLLASVITLDCRIDRRLDRIEQTLKLELPR